MKVFLILLGALSLGSALSQSRVWTEKEKREIFAELENTRRDLLTLVAPLTEKQFFYKPNDKSWSANDIVEHLGLIEEGYVREFWWALAQPVMPASYRDSTAGGDEKAKAYATLSSKSEARGTNLPLNRYSEKATCVRVFDTARNLTVDFFEKNGQMDMRGYYVFRKNGKGVREIRDLYQQTWWLLAHTIRHTNQLKAILSDPGFPRN